MSRSDPLGDFGGLMAVPTRPQREQEETPDPPKVEGFLTGASTTTRESLGIAHGTREGVREGSSPGIFDRDIAAFRHCRFPCDIPWHRH